MLNDVFQLAFARASGIPFATRDMKFVNAIKTYTPAFAGHIITP